jgi:hypothetical protein
MRLGGGALLLAVALVVTVGAIDIELVNRAEGVTSEAPAPVTFMSQGGKALTPARTIDVTTLLLDGEPAVRLVRADGPLNSEGAELTLVTASMPKPLRQWVSEFVRGKYKKHKVSIVARTPGSTNKAGKPSYSRFDYKGVLIREIELPALGAENGFMKIRIIYQKATEQKGVKSVPMLDVPFRSQFFKLTLDSNKEDKKAVKKPAAEVPKPPAPGTESSAKPAAETKPTDTKAPKKTTRRSKKQKKTAKPKAKRDTAGAVMAQSVYKIDSFLITRETGFGRQKSTTLNAWFRPSTSKKSAASQWERWYTGKAKKMSAEAGNDIATSTRNGKLTFYYWSGSNDGRALGQLKTLFELKLSGVKLARLDTGDGHAQLQVDGVQMIQPK